MSSILQTLKTAKAIPDSRYKFCLEKLFAAVRQGYQNNSREAQSIIQKHLLNTQTFNQRVNDLTQIINAITEDGLQTSNNIDVSASARR